MLNNCNTAAGMRVTAIAEKARAHFEFEFQAELEVLGGCRTEKHARSCRKQTLAADKSIASHLMIMQL